MIAEKTVLYVTHRFPYPPTGGAKVRAFYCLQHLARCNRVVVAAPLRGAEEAANVAALQAQGVEVLAEPISPLRARLQSAAYAAAGRPASMGYFRAPRLIRRLRRWIAETQPDLIVVHSSSVAPYVADVSGPAKVLDFVDMDSRKWLDYTRFTPFPRSAIFRWEGRNLARAEARLAKSFDRCLVATERERESLAEIAGPVPSAVVRNGVDLDYFTPAAAEYDPDCICFVGRMDYYPNEEAMLRFCETVWPRIRAQRPSAQLAIVGAAPTPAVRALAAQEGVTVTGTVEDVRPFLRRAALTVVPLAIARGTQNKILESMAMGVPVVASPIAARGVEAEPDTHLRVADGPEEMAEAALRLMSRPDERERLARAGRDRVESLYPWRCRLMQFEAALAQLGGADGDGETAESAMPAPAVSLK